LGCGGTLCIVGSPVPGIQAIEYIETHGEALFHEIARHDHSTAPRRE